MFAEACRHPVGELNAQLAIALMKRAVMPTPAEEPAPPVGQQRWKIGKSLAHPHRRRGGGRAENRLKVPLREALDDALDPIERERTVWPLHAVPAELADADGIEAKLLHERGVAVPLRFRIVLRVIRNAEADA